MAVLFLVALLSVPLCGGRLGALGELRLRAPWLIFTALAAQVVIISVVPGGDEDLYEAVHLGTYGVAGAFAWLNRRVPGLALAGLGGALNAVAIVANGGVMPARPGALRTAGLAEASATFENSAAVAEPRLAWLGDCFAVPASWPVSNVFSIGDVLLVLGVLIGLHVVAGSLPARRLRLHPVTVRGVELVETGTSRALVRVATVAHRGMDAGELLVHARGRRVRLEPLPGSTSVAGYAVPLSLLRGDATRLALALPNHVVVDLPAPARRRCVERVRSRLSAAPSRPMEGQTVAMDGDGEVGRRN